VFVVLVPILWETAKLSKKEAFLYNFAGSIFHNTIMYYWIYNVMDVGPPFVIMLGVSLLIIYFSLLNGYLGLLFKYVQNSSYGWLAYGLLWAGFEVARAKGQMSFPWGNIGYTLGSFLQLIQVCSVIGIFGLSFIIAASNFWIFRCFLLRKKAAVTAVFLICLVLQIYGMFSLRGESKQELAGTADISLVQPSIAQTRKWNEKYFNTVIEQTWGVMDAHDLKNSDLILLAETAVPAFLHRRPLIKQQIKARALKNRSDIIVGSLDFTHNDHPAKPFNFFNCAFLFTRDSAKGLKQYAKLNLVPFSEHIPFDNVFPALNYVDLGEGDFSSGKEIMIWSRNFKYSPTICYEVVYPGFIRKIKDRGAQLLVNITNDGWFGNSTAPYMHANICRFRAIETGMPVARCANSGISLFYDRKGRYLGKTKLFEQTVLRKKISLRNEDTLYQSIGTFIEEGLFWAWVLGNILIVFTAAKWRFLRKKG
jgi:apolipoprotein N-acyltransferase